MVLEATNLLRMVLQKLESVRLERNLKSCAKQMQSTMLLGSCRAQKLKSVSCHKCYLPSQEDVDKDSCFSCPSSPFSIFCLFYTSRCPTHIIKSVIASVSQLSSACNSPEVVQAHHPRANKNQTKHLPFFLVLIFVLNNKSAKLLQTLSLSHFAPTYIFCLTHPTPTHPLHSHSLTLTCTTQSTDTPN